jgi:hypothetical protein
MTKLSEADRIEIRERRRNKGTLYKTLAEDFGCSIPHVAAIVSGRVGAADAPSLPPKPEIRPHMMPGLSYSLLTGGNARRAKIPQPA